MTFLFFSKLFTKTHVIDQLWNDKVNLSIYLTYTTNPSSLKYPVSRSRNFAKKTYMFYL